MRTFTTYKTDTARFCNIDTSNTEGMNMLGGYINDSIRTVCNIQGGKLRFLEATKDMETVANQEGYQIPNGFRKLIDMWVEVPSSSTRPTVYMPEMVFDPTKWKLVKAYRLGTSNTPYFTYVENQKFYIQPIPSSSGNTIKLRGRLRVADLNIEDYTTGTIVSVANAGTDIVGSGTSWTADMVGMYIRITNTQAANGGDGFWYEIGSWTDATHITLLKPYEGTSIVAGSAAYTIGQTAPIPEAYDIAPVYRASALYWQNQKDVERAKMYWTMYDGGNEAGYSKDYGGIIDQMLANEGETEEGAYVPPFASTSNLPNAPYYYPYQDASGFN